MFSILSLVSIWTFCALRCSSWFFLARFGFSSSDVRCCFLLLFVAFCCFSLLFVARRCSFWLFIALDINHLPLVQNWCEWMKMGMKNALCCFLLLVLVFGACFHLPFVAFCCSSLLFLVFEIESILSQKPKQANAFYCSLWLFVARFGFLWMFPFEHRIARCGFLLVRKTKTSNERQKMSKWKPGFNRALSWAITSFGNKFCLRKRSRLIKALDNRFYIKLMQLEIGLLRSKKFKALKNLRKLI